MENKGRKGPRNKQGFKKVKQQRRAFRDEVKNLETVVAQQADELKKKEEQLLEQDHKIQDLEAKIKSLEADASVFWQPKE